MEARPITRADLAAILALKVGPGQDGLVAPNAVTLAQHPYAPGSQVWGLWEGAAAVGLVAMIDPAQDQPFPGEEPLAPGAAYVWRLMVDAAHQGKGYGRAALRHACQVARGWGYEEITLSVADAPHSNLGFYERLGFAATGRMPEGEVEMRADCALVEALLSHWR